MRSVENRLLVFYFELNIDMCVYIQHSFEAKKECSPDLFNATNCYMCKALRYKINTLCCVILLITYPA